MKRTEVIAVRGNSAVLLLNQIGVFMEAYGPDAEIVAALMERQVSLHQIGGESTKIVGIPYHELDTLLNKLSANSIQYEMRG